MPLEGTLLGDSIYITLEARPNPGEYHWGLILTDCNARPILHHASNLNGPWQYLQKADKPDQSLTMVVLIRVDKLKDYARALDIIQSVAADGNPSQRSRETFTCRIWVKDVLVALHQGGEIQLPDDIDVLEALAKSCGARYSTRAEMGHGATVINDMSEEECLLRASS